MVNGKIVSPNHPTCKNRVIDFFVVSNNIAGMVVGAITAGDALCKPHNPVRLYLRADARTMSVGILKQVFKLPAVLPRGPSWPHDDLGDVDNLTKNQKYELFVTRMDKEAISLLTLDDKAAKQYVGRADGPKFVQKNALGNEQGGTRRTTAVSRAWRRTAGWLDDLLKTHRQLAWEAALLKILTYRHPSPPPLKATPEQVERFKSFLCWRKRLTREMLEHSSWTLAMKKAATTNAG